MSCSTTTTARVLARLDQKVGGLFAFGRGHAGGGFIDQQQAGFLRQQHRDFQPLLLAVAQLAGFAVQLVAKADLVRPSS